MEVYLHSFLCNLVCLFLDYMFNIYSFLDLFTVCQKFKRFRYNFPTFFSHLICPVLQLFSWKVSYQKYISCLSYNEQDTSQFTVSYIRNKWTMNFQMLQLVLEKIEEQEIKLPTSAGSLKKQENSKKKKKTHLFLLYWLCQNI